MMVWPADPVLCFENEQFAVVDKPAGWLSVPSRLGRADPRPCLGRWLAEWSGLPVLPVHRLDECATGLLLFARTPAAQRVASGWFESGSVGKVYDAWTERSQLAEGSPPAPGELLEWRSRLTRGKRRAYVDDLRGKQCVTRARVRIIEPARLGWELTPRTGRPHQLRVELSRHGYPILGDRLYGARADWPAVEGQAVGREPEPSAIALRMWRLEVIACPEHQAFGLPERIDVQRLLPVDPWSTTSPTQGQSGD